MQVVILCGGKGTRIRDVTEDIPKPMIPIGGRPILWHIMKGYARHGFKKFILCLGYKSWVIKQYFLNYGLASSDVTLEMNSTRPVKIHNPSAGEAWWVSLLGTALLFAMAGTLAGLWQRRRWGLAASLAGSGLLLLSTLFHHSNLELPLRAERWLVRLIVTPRMHGIHHSTRDEEINSNWSNGLTLWDRLHGTLRLNVRQDEITIGVVPYRSPAEVKLSRMLRLPFTYRPPSSSTMKQPVSPTAELLP